LTEREADHRGVEVDVGRCAEYRAQAARYPALEELVHIRPPGQPGDHLPKNRLMGVGIGLVDGLLQVAALACVDAPAEQADQVGRLGHGGTEPRVLQAPRGSRSEDVDSVT